MNVPWFDAPARRRALVLEARAWIGTPFAAHGTIRGGGCSCETLPRALYQAVGFLPQGLALPAVTIQYFRAARGDGAMIPFLDARPDFQSVSPLRLSLACGDLLGFRAGRVVHHLGILLDLERFIHCLDPAGVALNSLLDATWGHRLERVWRPVET